MPRHLPHHPLANLSLRINTQIDAPKRRPVSTSAAAVPAVSQEIRPDCDPSHDLPKTAHPHLAHTRSASTSAVPTLFPASPTVDPTVYHTLNLVAPANTASVKLGATLFSHGLYTNHTTGSLLIYTSTAKPCATSNPRPPQHHRSHRQGHGSTG